MKVLIIGGTGNISSACVRLALDKGYDVTILHRGTTLPEDGCSHLAGRVTTLQADRNDVTFMRRVGQDVHYDVVASFLGFRPDQIELDVEAFAGRIGQYIHVSSGSVYQRPLKSYLVTEEAPIASSVWEYARLKIACEQALEAAYRAKKFPATIVRPSYTYGPTFIPNGVGGHGYTVVHRMRHGSPVISQGDGTSLWAMTYNTDFAVGFVGLFGQTNSIGEAYHITSDEVMTWDDIYQAIARAAGSEARLVHIPSEFIAAGCPSWAGGLLGEKAHSVVYDNTKIRRAVPEFRPNVTFAEGIARTMAWHDADAARRVVNEQANRTMDHLIAAYHTALLGMRPM